MKKLMAVVLFLLAVQVSFADKFLVVPDGFTGFAVTNLTGPSNNVYGALSVSGDVSVVGSLTVDGNPVLTNSTGGSVSNTLLANTAFNSFVQATNGTQEKFNRVVSSSNFIFTCSTVAGANSYAVKSWTVNNGVLTLAGSVSSMIKTNLGAMCIVSNYLFVGSDVGRLSVIDVSNPYSMTVNFSTNMGSGRTIGEMDSNGSNLLVLAMDDALRILDISSPLSPSVIYSNASANTREAVKFGPSNCVYVANYDQQRVEIYAGYPAYTNVNNMVVSFVNPDTVRLNGNSLYVFPYNGTKMDIYGLASNPTNPTAVLTNYNVGSTIVPYYGSANNFYGNYMLIPVRGENVVKVFDVRNPSNVFHAASLNYFGAAGYPLWTHVTSQTNLIQIMVDAANPNYRSLRAIDNPIPALSSLEIVSAYSARSASNASYASVAGLASNVTVSVSNSFNGVYLGKTSNAVSASYASVAGVASNAPNPSSGSNIVNFQTMTNYVANSSPVPVYVQTAGTSVYSALSTTSEYAFLSGASIVAAQVVPLYYCATGFGSAEVNGDYYWDGTLVSERYRYLNTNHLVNIAWNGSIWSIRTHGGGGGVWYDGGSGGTPAGGGWTPDMGDSPGGFISESNTIVVATMISNLVGLVNFYTHLIPSGSNTLDIGSFNAPMRSVIASNFVGKLTAYGDILPSVSNAFDLGSTNFPFRDLYVSSNSVKYVGGNGQIVAVLSASTVASLTGESTNLVPLTAANPTGDNNVVTLGYLNSNGAVLSSDNVFSGNSNYFNNVGVSGVLNVNGLSGAAGYGSWGNTAGLPTTLGYHSSAARDDGIYVAGGLTGTGGAEQTAVYRYNGVIWTNIASLPAGRQSGAMAVWDGDLYYMGGYSGGIKDDVYRYNGSAWTNVASLPKTLYALSAVGTPNGLYAIGGIKAGESTNVYCYTGSVWSNVAGLPDGRSYFGAVYQNGQIYVMGGEKSSVAKTNMYVYNGAAWASVAGLPTPLAFIGAGSLNGKIYTVGGSSSNVYEYDGNGWTNSPAIPLWTKANSVSVWSNRIYCIGGFNQVITYRTNVYSFASALPIQTWKDSVGNTVLELYYNGLVRSSGFVLNADTASNAVSASYASVAGVASNVTVGVSNSFNGVYLGIGSNAVSAFYASVAGIASNVTAITGSGRILMSENGTTSVLYHVTSGNHTNKIGEFFTSP